jgi:hypothetical protein
MHTHTHSRWYTHRQTHIYAHSIHTTYTHSFAAMELWPLIAHPTPPCTKSRVCWPPWRQNGLRVVWVLQALTTTCRSGGCIVAHVVGIVWLNKVRNGFEHVTHVLNIRHCCWSLLFACTGILLCVLHIWLYLNLNRHDLQGNRVRPAKFSNSPSKCTTF